MKKLIILGASGHGKVVADVARLNGYDSIVFLDDDKTIQKCGNYEVAGKCNEAENMDGDIVVGIGNSKDRQRLCDRFSTRLVTLIHPDAVISDSVRIGIGTVVMAGVVVNSDSIIGKGCIINTSSSVDHDCEIGDYCHIAVGSHLSGTVKMGNHVWVGAGAIISNQVSVCAGTIIGAGAVVIRNIDKIGTYVGVPAAPVAKSGGDTEQPKK